MTEKIITQKVKSNGSWVDVIPKRAVNADKATSDKNGSDITATYATKTELTSGLDGKSNTGHIHPYLPDTTKYAKGIGLSVDNSTYVITAQLKDQDGNDLGTKDTIDLPLESVVVSGSYDSANKKVKLELKNGSTVDFSVADLVSGLVSDTDSRLSDSRTPKSHTLSSHTNDYLTSLKLHDGVNVRTVITAYDDGDGDGTAHNFGSEVVLQGGGNMFVGAGESPEKYRSKITSHTGENLYLTADGVIVLGVNADDYDARKEVTLNKSAELSGLAKVTSTSFVGALTGNCSGNAATATKATGDQNGDNIADTYKRNYLESGAYENVPLCSTSASGSCTNYQQAFMDVTPASWYDAWHVKIIIEAQYTVKGTVYNQRNVCDLSGYGNSNGMIYHNWNSLTNTSYKPFTYLRVNRPANKAQFDAGTPYRFILWGSNHQYANGSTVDAFSRTLKVYVLEADHCTFNLYDSLDGDVYQKDWYDTLATSKANAASLGHIVYTNASNISLQYYDFDIYNNGLRETGDDNTFNQLYDDYYRPYSGTQSLYRYRLVMQGADGRMYSISTGDQTNTTIVQKPAQTVALRPERVWYWSTGSTLNANTVLGDNTLKQTLPFDPRYTFNETLPKYSDVYLCGDYNSTTGLFTLLSTTSAGAASNVEWYNFASTNTATRTWKRALRAGKYYLRVGGSDETDNHMQLFMRPEMLYCDGTNLISASATATKLTGAAKINYISDAAPQIQLYNSDGTTLRATIGTYGAGKLKIESKLTGTDSDQITLKGNTSLDGTLQIGGLSIKKVEKDVDGTTETALFLNGATIKTEGGSSEVTASKFSGDFKGHLQGLFDGQIECSRVAAESIMNKNGSNTSSKFPIVITLPQTGNSMSLTTLSSENGTPQLYLSRDSIIEGRDPYLNIYATWVRKWEEDGVEKSKEIKDRVLMASDIADFEKIGFSNVASQLTASNMGDRLTPIYLDEGRPVACDRIIPSVLYRRAISQFPDPEFCTEGDIILMPPESSYVRATGDAMNGSLTVTGTVSATSFSGPLTGNVTGTASGNLTSNSDLNAGKLTSGSIHPARYVDMEWNNGEGRADFKTVSDARGLKVKWAYFTRTGGTFTWSFKGEAFASWNSYVVLVTTSEESSGSNLWSYMSRVYSRSSTSCVVGSQQANGGSTTSQSHVIMCLAIGY